MQRFIIDRSEEGRRLDQFLTKLLPCAETSFIFKMVRKKNITVNRGKAKPDLRLRAGDSVEMFFSEETFVKMSGGRIDPAACTVEKNAAAQENRDEKQISTQTDVSEYLKAYSTIRGIRIVYEDGDFIFIDKPANVLSQKAGENDCSANEWLIGYMLESGGITPRQLVTFRPAFCNRLDRNTTGLMLGGKNLEALRFLSELLRDRTLHKYYLAELTGEPDDALDITSDCFRDYYAYLVKNRKNNKVRIFENETDADSYAEETGSCVSDIHTSVRLIEKHNGSMKVEIELYTGKSHQIRAHLAHLGHPVLGDPKYGPRSKASGSVQLLRAYRVVFPAQPLFPALNGVEIKTDQDFSH